MQQKNIGITTICVVALIPSRAYSNNASSQRQRASAHPQSIIMSVANVVKLLQSWSMPEDVILKFKGNCIKISF